MWGSSIYKRDKNLKTININTRRATPHRVRFVGDDAYLDRYSIALFVHPNSDVKIKPFKKRENGAEEESSSSDRDEPMSALEYVNKRFAETYIEQK